MEQLFTPSKRKNGMDQKKQRLITIAEEGSVEFTPQGRIHSKDASTRKLFFCFQKYVEEDHLCYDPVFKETIDRIRPAWITPTAYKIVKKKERILELAELHKDSLTRSGVIIDSLRNAIGRYTNIISIEYDEEFTVKLAEINPYWLHSSTRDQYIVKELEKFFLENCRFPNTMKSSYKDDPETWREGFLHYWLREIGRTKRRSKHAKISKKKARLVHSYIRKTALPNNLLTTDLKFFNRSMRYLKELGAFYKEHKRLPTIYRGRDKLDGSTTTDENERRLCLWLRARSRETGRSAEWRRIAKPLLKHLGLPKYTFS